jgi:C4-type Zn-finger protein
MPNPSDHHIYCPACEWRPASADRWQCIPSCGTIWNTFWTGGVCPGCGYQWEKTQCLACGVVSPHRKWYHPRTKRAAQATQKARELID